MISSADFVHRNGLGCSFVDVQVPADRRLQGHHGAVAATPQLVLRQTGEETLHQIEPGTVGRREMAMEAPVAEQPLLHLGGLVGSVVVEDQVDVQVVGGDPVDMPRS